jgi:GTP-binding protein YchF
VVDIAGLAEGASRGEGRGNRFLADIRGVDAVAHVIRAFSNPDVAHVRQNVDPTADVELGETELGRGDLELVERRVEKARKAARSGDKAARHELAVLETLVGALQQGRLARAIERAPEDGPLYRELALVSDRPVLFVLNVGDGEDPGDVLARQASFVDWARGRGDRVVAVAARLEAELADLDADEAALFREELGGAAAGAVDILIRAAYEVLGYITFFTGDFRSSESRAWQLPRGWTAKQAAGRIHSDIEHGFVRAQVVSIEDLLGLGSFHAAREAAKLRTEGKDYVVQDGDVINFMHTG